MPVKTRNIISKSDGHLIGQIIWLSESEMYDHFINKWWSRELALLDLEYYKQWYERLISEISNGEQTPSSYESREEWVDHVTHHLLIREKLTQTFNMMSDEEYKVIARPEIRSDIKFWASEDGWEKYAQARVDVILENGGTARKAINKMKKMVQASKDIITLVSSLNDNDFWNQILIKERSSNPYSQKETILEEESKVKFYGHALKYAKSKV